MHGDQAIDHVAFPLPDAPTLVLQGLRDEVVTPDLAPEFVRRMHEWGREARLVLLDDGHELNADLPRRWREIEPHLPAPG